MIIGQLLITASNILGLEAARAQNQGIKIALHTAENLTKLLAFSNLKFDIAKNGALGLTAMLALDDIAINQGLYESHHLAKVGSAIYAGLKCSSYISEAATEAAMEAAIWSGGLFAGSYLFGSGDIVDIMRSNTNDSIEFADEVYETSNGKVDIHKDMIAGSLIGGVLSGGQKLIQPLSLDPLSNIISATTSTAVNIISSSNSEKNFKNILVDKFQNKLRYISLEQINKLDYRAQKIFEKLPEYIEKAGGCITKNATNTGLKTAYQNTLASSKFNNQESDIGLSVFVIANLFNFASPDSIHSKVKKNLNALKVDDDFNKLTADEKIYDIGKKLNVLKDKKSDSVTTKLLNFAKTAVKIVGPVLIGSILVARMHDPKIFGKKVFDYQKADDDKELSQSKLWKNVYMPIGSILSIGESFVDVDGFTAIKQLQYLEDALEQVYTYDSQYQVSECTQHSEAFHQYDLDLN